MIYSIWRAGAYDYYEAPSGASSGPTPEHLRGLGGEIGVSHDQAAWPLPNAPFKRCGRGPLPVGKIAQLPGTSQALGDIPKASNILMIAAVALGAWWVLR